MSDFLVDQRRKAEQERRRIILDGISSLGKFDIQTEINEGMNAYAFKARHLQLGKEVFIKVYDYDDSFASEALREPQHLARMTSLEPKCENIVDVHDAQIISTSAGRFVLLQMELLSGGSLNELICSRAVGQQESIRITTSILRGLAYLHAQRLLHRDLKPANIVLEGDTPKISDFGSVALLPDASSFVKASRHSILYVPPEGWENPSRYGFVSDIYQIGMLLYELISGPLEYGGNHYIPVQLKKRWVKENRTLPEIPGHEIDCAIKAGIAEHARKATLLYHGRTPRLYMSDKLKRIIRQATHPLVEKRFQSANEFLGALSKINLPNWLPAGDSFIARSWKGKDWKVSSNGNEILLENLFENGRQRLVIGTKGKFARQEDAFDFVESM